MCTPQLRLPHSIQFCPSGTHTALVPASLSLYSDATLDESAELIAALIPLVDITYEVLCLCVYVCVCVVCLDELS